MTDIAKEPTAPCLDHRHRLYHLSCAQYASLRAFTAGRCNICGVKERYAPCPFYIDHDHTLGMWAVRGLLCPRCNTVIEMPGKLVGPEVDSYLALPWHVRARLTPPPPPTPRAVRKVATQATTVDAARRSCEEALSSLGEMFKEMRARTGGMDSAARKFAREQLVPVVVQARGHGISPREVARRTGYTPEHVYTLWRYAEPLPN